MLYLPLTAIVYMWVVFEIFLGKYDSLWAQCLIFQKSNGIIFGGLSEDALEQVWCELSKKCRRRFG